MQSEGSTKLVYIHIGKTGGTSLRSILSVALGVKGCSQGFLQSHMTAADAAKYQEFQVIVGHISRSDQVRWFPDRQVITVLREPIDRCLSFVHYARSLPPDSFPAAAEAHRLSALDFIETAPAQENVYNTMVRQLGGHMLDPPTDLPQLLERAKETLRDALWVARQETLQADLLRLSAILGRDLSDLRENVTPTRPAIENEPKELVDRLMELNRYDMRLWDWANSSLL